jgi:nicotinate dehydrogenase subunit B
VTAWPIGARLFAGACASCHIANTALAPLALGSALHAPRPDNLLQAVLHGVPAPAESIVATSARAEEIEAMPSFANAFNDAQLTELAGYLRARFAPDKSAWSDVGGAVIRVRPSPPGRVH